MAVNGIGSYSDYQSQSLYSLLRASNNSKYVDPISKVINEASTSETSTSGTSTSGASTSSSSASGSSSSVSGFLRDYQSALTGIEDAAAKLNLGSSKNVFNDFQVASTDEDVATVSRDYKLRSDTDITLNVQSLAQKQQNISASHYGQEAVEPGADMEFRIDGAAGSAMVSISSTNDNGTAKTYNQMYQDAAKAINAQNAGVKASVSNVEGKVSLVLTSVSMGEAGGFTVTGNAGSSAGIETAATAAQDAVYTVTENGQSQTYKSSTNNISLDYGRIGVQLKDTGETQIYAGIDADAVTSAVEDLISNYNSAMSVLSKNSGAGIGASNHLASFKRGLADEKTLELLGITYNKDGKLTLDKDVLKNALETDYDRAKDLLGGQFGIAQKAMTKANNALSDSVERIVSNSVSKSSASSTANGLTDTSSFKYMSRFARSGAYNMGNYYAVGLLLNTMA